MSRLTGKEVYSLMEAYQQVYTPQELTEEQVWEGVENWVHSLLEEGYDLSDYTWEEMYEEYIIEIGGIGGQKALDDVRARSAAEQQSAAKMDTLRAQRFGPGSYRTAGPKISAERPQSRFAGARDAAIAKAQNIKGSPVVGPKIVGSGTPTPAAPAPAARPSAPAPAARPSAPAPGAKPDAAKTLPTKPMGGDPMDQWARANPTLAAKVKPGQSGYNTIRTRLDADNDRQENYDAYDLVLSHLINEGYADTEEAALTIMSNMSEDWRQSIVEAYEEFPMQKVVKKAGELMGSSAGKNDPKSKKRTKRGIKMMDVASTHTPDR
jgi:hypothetical protein